jgi:uncharacterized phage protein gp47/JayE
VPVAPSYDALLTQGVAEALLRRPTLAFEDGDIPDVLMRGGAAMADAVIRFGAQALIDTFIASASGQALTDLVNDHLNIQRKEASAAQVTVEFERTSGGGAGNIPAGTRVATGFDAAGNQVVFTTDVAVPVPAANNGPFAVACTAEVAGPDGNAAAGTVVNILDVLFDSTFTVENPATAGGGQDRESDDQLRSRARLFFATLRRGTLAALEFGALLVPTVGVAVAVEDQQSGLVTVRVSDADGNSTAQMIADVETELENWRCAGTIVQVAGGIRSVVDVVAQLTVRPRFNVAARESDFEDAYSARVDKLRVGETLFLDMIIAALITVAPDDVFEVTFTAVVVDAVGQPVDDVAAGTSQVLRPGTLSVSEAP